MARRGRPAGTDSAATKQRILETARGVFAKRGFAATTVAELAAAAELAPSAIYHYFGGKTELYEAVFEATADDIWTEIGGATRIQGSLHESMTTLVQNTGDLSTDRPHHNDFLALVPMEARLHPEFAHLMERRSKYQDETFGGLATLGIKTGELTGYSQAEATELLRSLVMGWFFESHFRHGAVAAGGRALVKVIEDLSRSGRIQ